MKSFLRFVYPKLVGKGWSDEAREASIVARQGKHVDDLSNRAANALMRVTARGEKMTLQDMRHVNTEVISSIEQAQQVVSSLPGVPAEIHSQMHDMIEETKSDLGFRRWNDAIQSSRGVFELAHAAVRQSTSFKLGKGKPQ